MYDEQRYNEPDAIKNVVMRIVGRNSLEYYLCCNEDEAVVVMADSPHVFMATLEYVVANGIIHAMTDGMIVDHSIDYDAWCSFRRYAGDYSEPTKDKYTAWLES